jgi:1-acyl-sn-glycerol-3-phosphate acyltransferase
VGHCQARRAPDRALGGYSAAVPFIDAEISQSIDSLPNRVNELGYDAWGFNPGAAKRLYSIGKRFLWPYFRPETHGIENLPAGRVLIVPNHSGQISVDGIVIALACLVKARPPRLVRPMVERYLSAVPFVNELLWRGGAVLGDPGNCRNLLEDDQAIVVFPEGAKGGGKVWRDRYRLAPFGRGFMRLALQTRTPIVPTAVIGGEESVISLYDFKPGARALGLPYLPITPLLPLLGPASILPMPVKFHLWFGKPMQFEGRHDVEDAVLDRKVEEVRTEVQRMVEAGRAQRRGIF